MTTQAPSKEQFPFYGHNEGLVISGPDERFAQRPMTPAELAARQPALSIAKDIYRHANQAGVCYAELWALIAMAMQKLLDEVTAHEPCALLEEMRNRMECHFQPCASYWTTDDDMVDHFDPKQCDCKLGKPASPQPPGDDARRLDLLEHWLANSKKCGFQWDTFRFETDKTVRERLDELIALHGFTSTK